jgi:redox-sensitive bicupin YhaK (pirin superfamily)
MRASPRRNKMITLRPAAERGHANHGWLDSHHTFSFADYFDPAHMGFGALRVINEDRVAPGGGFGTHGHRDMEIFSYVVEGALAHRDSMGNGSTIRPGDIQIMSAGTGIRHSEYNGSDAEGVHFLQIWLLPESNGLTPRYDERRFTEEDKLNRLRLILSPDARDGSVKLHQDASIYASVLEPGKTVETRLAEGRKGWVQVIKGAVDVNGTRAVAGDGLAIEGERALTIKAGEKAEFLLFDLA